MRLWSLHPKYLDPQGLVALWREALLAQAVLKNETTGYRNHPQLDRFRIQKSPVSAIAQYLEIIHTEAQNRGYNFDRNKIGTLGKKITIPVTSGQIAYEWGHLMKKLSVRNPSIKAAWKDVLKPEPHGLFHVCSGPVETWERPLT